MAARIRTLNFLPEVFQTPTNAQFLGATLDQIVDQPNTMRIEGYVGSKFGYGINAKDKYIYTHRLDSEAGSSVTFDKVMFVDNSGKIMIGLPSLKGASVTGKVLEHLKDDKVIVFKKKRRKGYKKKNGHRQYLSKVLIESINA